MIVENNYRVNNCWQFWIIYLGFLTSMFFWPTWGHSDLIYFVISFALGADFLIRKERFATTRQNMLLSILLIFAAWQAFGVNFVINLAVPFFYLICMQDSVRVHLLNFITHWHSRLLLVSIIFYLLYIYIGLPSFGNMWAHEEGYGMFYNYIFYVHSDFYGYRFNGPFIEPGHLGMISAFLLFANKFDFKNKAFDITILILSVLFSLSLAGYLLSIIAYILVLYNKREFQAKYIIVFFCALFACFLFASYYNGGDNVINEEILSRLEYDEEHGIAGNNRAHSTALILYDIVISDTSLLWNGYGWRALKEGDFGGTGYTVYIVIHGLKGVLLALSFYLLFPLLNTNRRYALTVFAFVCAVFWQRSYPFWLSWIICIVCTVSNEINSTTYNIEEDE